MFLLAILIPVCASSSPAFLICRLFFFDDGHSDQCKVIPHCSFDLHFCNSNVGHICMCVMAMLEKTLESPLDSKEIQPVHSEGDQPWDFFGRNDAKAETPVLWPPHAKN